MKLCLFISVLVCSLSTLSAEKCEYAFSSATIKQANTLIQKIIQQPFAFRSDLTLKEKIKRAGVRTNNSYANELQSFMAEINNLTRPGKINALVKHYRMKSEDAAVFILAQDPQAQSLFLSSVISSFKNTTGLDQVDLVKDRITKDKAIKPKAKAKQKEKIPTQKNTQAKSPGAGKGNNSKLPEAAEKITSKNLEKFRSEIIPVIKIFNKQYLNAKKADDTKPFIDEVLGFSVKIANQYSVQTKADPKSRFIKGIKGLNITNSDLRNSLGSPWYQTPSSRVYLALHYMIEIVNSRLDDPFKPKLVLRNKSNFVEFLDMILSHGNYKSKSFDLSLLE